MNDPRTIGVIRPELVASKLAAIRNYEQPKLLDQISANPRLVEMLWFIQFVSMQPGGMAKFCETMLALLPHRFGTETMRRFGSGEYPTEAKVKIWSEIPCKYHPTDCPQSDGEEDLWSARAALDDGFCIVDLTPAERGRVERFLSAWGRLDFQQICSCAAKEVLPGYLAELCQYPEKGFDQTSRWANFADLWFIDDPIAAVFEMMGRHATEASKRLAMTAVTRKVFDALDYALQERAMVRIEGNSRFGKTESVRAWCQMRPGLARLVSVPSSNSVSDLHNRVAEALGMDVSYGSRKQGVRERVEFVLRHSGLLIALDEGAFLVPQNYTRETAPARLNWVRTEIVDRGLPLAVVVTPQSFLPLVDRFVKKTGYAMEQFFGRNHRRVYLPDDLDHSDLVAVARVHFPEFGEAYLELVADMAETSENYLQAVEAIAKLARYIARREGHPRVTADDLTAAAAEVIPPHALKPGKSQTAVIAPKHDREKAAFKTHSRGLKPIGTLDAEDENLRSCSLRDAGPERVKTDLISVET